MKGMDARRSGGKSGEALDTPRSPVYGAAR
jgi:hypothetical protein